LPQVAGATKFFLKKEKPVLSWKKVTEKDTKSKTDELFISLSENEETL